MLRDKNLIPLSRQHQHALALCVRIDRASPISEADLAAWQAEVVQLFDSEIRIHFAAEERVLFPAARQFEKLLPLVEELESDHSKLREAVVLAESGSMSARDLSRFAQCLSAHIRKEERELFQRLQELMTEEQLAFVGKQLDSSLEGAAQACALPAHKIDSKT
jgi:hemerythrin-like domain-containing protein